MVYIIGFRKMEQIKRGNIQKKLKPTPMATLREESAVVLTILSLYVLLGST